MKVSLHPSHETAGRKNQKLWRQKILSTRRSSVSAADGSLGSGINCMTATWQVQSTQRSYLHNYDLDDSESTQTSYTTLVNRSITVRIMMFHSERGRLVTKSTTIFDQGSCGTWRAEGWWEYFPLMYMGHAAILVRRGLTRSVGEGNVRPKWGQGGR